MCRGEQEKVPKFRLASLSPQISTEAFLVSLCNRTERGKDCTYRYFARKSGKEDTLAKSPPPESPPQQTTELAESKHNKESK